MEHIRDSIKELHDRGNVSYFEYRELTMNSYEQEYLHEVMSVNDIIRLLQDIYLPNCTPPRHGRPYATYDEAVLHEFVPMLIQGYKELEEQLSSKD